MRRFKVLSATLTMFVLTTSPVLAQRAFEPLRWSQLPGVRTSWDWPAAERPVPGGGLGTAARIDDGESAADECSRRGSLDDGTACCSVQMTPGLTDIARPGGVACAGTAVLMLVGIRLRRRLPDGIACRQS